MRLSLTESLRLLACWGRRVGWGVHRVSLGGGQAKVLGAACPGPSRLPAGLQPCLHGTSTPVCPSPTSQQRWAPCAGPLGHMAGRGGEWLLPSRPHQLRLCPRSGWALSCALSPPSSLAHRSQAGSVPVPSPLCEGSTPLLFIIILILLFILRRPSE